ncbi:MAG: cytochrome C oxidase subunit IV family protein [Anaerolineae bacterium]
MEEKHETKHKHPNYLLIFVGLGILTAIEIAITSSLPEATRLPILLTLSLIKAVLVALFYMHLLNDSRLYAFFFAMAIFLLAIPFVLSLLVMQATGQ